MEIKININQKENTFDVGLTFSNINDMNIGDLLGVLNSAKKMMENKLSDYLQENKINITKKNYNKILSSIKFSDLTKSDFSK